MDNGRGRESGRNGGGKPIRTVFDIVLRLRGSLLVCGRGRIPPPLSLKGRCEVTGVVSKASEQGGGQRDCVVGVREREMEGERERGRENERGRERE